MEKIKETYYDKEELMKNASFVKVFDKLNLIVKYKLIEEEISKLD